MVSWKFNISWTFRDSVTISIEVVQRPDFKGDESGGHLPPIRRGDQGVTYVQVEIQLQKITFFIWLINSG